MFVREKSSNHGGQLHSDLATEPECANPKGSRHIIINELQAKWLRGRSRGQNTSIEYKDGKT